MSYANEELCRWCNKSRDFNHTFTAGYCLDNYGSVIYEHRFEVTPPSPQPAAPQEIENLPLCDGVCDCGGCPHFNSHDPWNMRSEPKPAPQTEQTEWHVCGWDMTLPGCEGMVEVLDSSSRLVCRAKDRATAEFIVSRASIAAAKGTR